MLFATVLVAVGVLLAATGPATATPGVQFGIEQNGGMGAPDSRTELLDIQRGLGSTVIRFQLRYDQIATCDPAGNVTRGGPTAPTNACYDFTVPDAVAQGAAARGMTVIFSIYGVPAWEFGGKFNFTGDTDAQFAAFSADLADFSQAAATRYDGRHGQARITQWTIWNEPNGSYFFEPRFNAAKQLIGAQRYARMYDAAARRIKLVDPAMLVAPGPTAPMPKDLRPLTWMRSALPVLQALGSPIDGWAHNAYMGSQAPFSTTLKDPVVGLGNVDDLTAELDRYAVTRGKPVWITEFGYQTPPASQTAVAPERQAELFDEAAYFVYAHPRITTFIWYSLFDDGGANDPTTFQAGLYYQNGRCGVRLCPKPVASHFLHTLYVSPQTGSTVRVFAQGRLAPAKTRVWLRRAGGQWQSFINASTATTGTVELALVVSDGMQVMTCDTFCGPVKTLSSGPGVAGGGPGARVVRRSIRGVRLAKQPSLRHGIVYGFSCNRCSISATVIGKGRKAGLAAARRRAVVAARGRVTRTATSARIVLRFPATVRRELTRRSAAKLVIRTRVTSADGTVTFWDQPLTLS